MDFLPRSDNGLLAWTNPFSSQITATPLAFGCSTSQASLLASDLQTYATKLAASQAGPTRGLLAVQQKDESKKILVAEIRALARQINGTQSVTNDQRTQLGLNIRRTPVTIPVPSMQPVLIIDSVQGRSVNCKVKPAEGAKRSFPAGTKSLFIYSYVGATAPADPSAYTFQGTTTRGKFRVDLPLSVPGNATVWITAMFANPRNECGPGSTPISTYLQAGTATQAA